MPRLYLISLTEFLQGVVGMHTVFRVESLVSNVGSKIIMGGHIVPLEWIEYGFGYIIIRSPYTTYSTYKNGDYTKSRQPPQV